MQDVQLVQLDPAIDAALIDDPMYIDAMVRDDWTQVAAIVHQVVGRTLTAVPLSVNELHWGGYFVVDARTREVVGSCAFKGPPTDDKTVELAYFTYPEFEGRGYATSMATKLVELARGSTDVRRVIAHTLPQANASTCVLEKVGMQFVGEVVDAEDGDVWQWQTLL